MGTWGDAIRRIFAKVVAMLSSPTIVKEALLDSSALTRTREIVADAIRMNFLKSRNPDTGGTWKPVQRGGQPLILYGDLMRKASAAGGAATVTESGILCVMDEPFYGAFHQHGTKSIVPRPFFGIPNETKSELADVIGKSISKKFTGIVQGSEDYQGYLF